MSLLRKLKIYEQTTAKLQLQKNRVEESTDLPPDRCRTLAARVGFHHWTGNPSSPICDWRRVRSTWANRCFCPWKQLQATLQEKTALEQADVAIWIRGFGRPVWRCSVIWNKPVVKWVDSPTQKQNPIVSRLSDKPNKLMLALTDEFKMSFEEASNQANELENCLRPEQVPEKTSEKGIKACTPSILGCYRNNTMRSRLCLIFWSI